VWFGWTDGGLAGWGVCLIRAGVGCLAFGAGVVRGAAHGASRGWGCLTGLFRWLWVVAGFGGFVWAGAWREGADVRHMQGSSVPFVSGVASCVRVVSWSGV